MSAILILLLDLAIWDYLQDHPFSFMAYSWFLVPADCALLYLAWVGFDWWWDKRAKERIDRALK